MKKLLRNFMIFVGFIFMLYTSYFLYFYSKRAEYAAILLQKALRYEEKFFNEKTQNLDSSEQIELRHEFEKEKLKLEKYCSDAIINGENGHCKVYYNLDSTIFIFTTGEIKISRWATTLITKASSFIKKYLIAMITEAKNADRAEYTASTMRHLRLTILSTRRFGWEIMANLP
nr:hypothetical protein [uncultured Campylobacter sp.]